MPTPRTRHSPAGRRRRHAHDLILPDARHRGELARAGNRPSARLRWAPHPGLESSPGSAPRPGPGPPAVVAPVRPRPPPHYWDDTDRKAARTHPPAAAVFARRRRRQGLT